MPSQIMKKLNMHLEKTFKNNQNIELKKMSLYIKVMVLTEDSMVNSITEVVNPPCGITEKTISHLAEIIKEKPSNLAAQLLTC